MNTTLSLKNFNIKTKPKSPFIPIKIHYRIALLVVLGLQLLIEFIEFLNSSNEATSLAAIAAL